MEGNIIKQRSPTLLGQILKDYRENYDLNQEQLASYLDVDVRTIRRWENGETILTDVVTLQRIAERVNVEPERLGVLSPIYTPETPEQIDEVVSFVWSLVNQARNNEARMYIERLVREVHSQIDREDHAYLRPLAHAYHTAGYVTAMSTRTHEVSQAIYYFQEMEDIARILNDDTMLNIALTYHGDMLRRKGDIAKAITYLRAAYETTPGADVAARGNGAQLLARVSLRAKDTRSFERFMAEAERLVHEMKPEAASTYGQYNLGTVYEEYGKSYGILGQTQQALDYLTRAEENLSHTKFWEILLMISRSEILLRSGDIDNGLPLAVEAAKWCRMYGQHRRLERIYSLKRELNQLIVRLGKAEIALSEALEGPIEY
jgi:transcriptional regulator with XRE-family HTH domain